MIEPASCQPKVKAADQKSVHDLVMRCQQMRQPDIVMFFKKIHQPAFGKHGTAAAKTYVFSIARAHVGDFLFGVLQMLQGFVGMMQQDLAVFVQHYVTSVAVKKLPAHFFFQPGNDSAQVGL